jgi:hypothetical protein
MLIVRKHVRAMGFNRRKVEDQHREAARRDLANALWLLQQLRQLGDIGRDRPGRGCAFLIGLVSIPIPNKAYRER